jgi:hypothetical protein
VKRTRKYTYWIELDEGDPGFQFLREEEISAVASFLNTFISTI